MADIVLKDRYGEDQNYTGAKGVKMLNADGELQIFSPGEAVENVPIVLDFSEGDQTVTAPEGTLVKSAIIQKPENLTPGNILQGVNIAGVEGTVYVPVSVDKTVELDFSGGDMVVTPETGKVFSQVNIPIPANLKPENIAEGVDIAGIIGTLVSGGSAKIASGYVGNSTGIVKTVTHNLGVIPDIVVVMGSHQSRESATKMAVGFSTAFAETLNLLYVYTAWTSYSSSNTAATRTKTGEGIELIASGTEGVSAATETTVDLGMTSYPLPKATISQWIAIGGLT